MSKLQNNFTTSEQSKRLLELGVPKWTADFYMDKYEVERFDEPYPYFIPQNVTFEHYDFDSFIPCWSVGRLMEIYHICIPNTSIYGWSYHEDVDGSYIDYIIQEYIDAYGELDFLKLDE